MRRVSIYVTKVALRMGLSANAVTLLMWVAGIAASLVMTQPGLGWAVLAALLIQFYLLLDCSDGEVARFRRTISALGVYLDRLGHYVVEGSLLVAVGVRADRPLWGCAAALLALLAKAETDLIEVARSSTGLSKADETQAGIRVSGLARMRTAASAFPLHRVIGAVEASLLAVIADIFGWQAELIVALAVVAALVVVGHLLAVIFSNRLR